jgi:hypothetical protein
MSDQKIRIAFTHVTVLKASDWIGSGDFYFIATIDGRSVGTRSVLVTQHGRQFEFPQPQWSAEVDVAGKTSVKVTFHCKDWDIFVDDDLGSLEYTIRPPWKQAAYRSSNPYFVVEWEVRLLANGDYLFHPPHTIFTARQHAGAVNYTTVSGGSGRLRGEIHPVCPVPPAASHPPRPVMPAGTAAPWIGGAAAAVTTASPINVITNPAYIPILAAADASATTAAILELSYYQPGTLSFADNDERLTWTVVPLTAGAAVAFVGPARGRKVLVYGTAAGEVRLEVRMRGALVTSYRALVGRIKQIPCRFNILNGPNAASQPRSTPADVQAHLTITNRFLRPAGIELVLDTNPARTNNAAATTIPGIFRIKVSAGTTRNIPGAGFQAALRLNYRPGVMNFAYIHSDAGGNLGAASDYPASGAGASITDSGTPSSSWNIPSGVPPDGGAAAVTMTLLAARQRPGHPNLFAMHVNDANGNPASPVDRLIYANTIAHELGHILNLPHRVDNPLSPFNDGINFPPNENMMHFNNPGTIAQDFDLVQVRAIHRSPLVPP